MIRRLASLVMTGTIVGLAVVSSTVLVPAASAACAQSDGSFAREVGPYADTVVLARVGMVESVANPMESDGLRLVTVHVSRVLSGEAEPTLQVPASVLGDCSHPSAIGDDIVLAFVSAWPSGAFVASWHEDEQGQWWHHFDKHASLGGLRGALGILPDTATAGPGSAPPEAIKWPGTVALLLIILGFALVMDRRLVRRRSPDGTLDGI